MADTYTILQESSPAEKVTSGDMAALARAKPQDFTMPPRVVNPDEVKGFPMDLGVGGAATGRLGMTEEFVRTAVEGHQRVIPLVLSSSGASKIDLGQFDHADNYPGVIICKGLSHIPDSGNRPTAFIAEKNPRFAVEYTNGIPRALLIKDDLGTVVERVPEGAVVTLDGHNKCLYASALEVERPSLPPNTPQLLAIADKLREDGRAFSFTTTATNTHQAEVGCRIGSAGFSLIRSEDFFKNKEGDAILQPLLRDILAGAGVSKEGLRQFEDFQRRILYNIHTKLFNLKTANPSLCFRLLDGRVDDFIPGEDKRHLSELAAAPLTEITRAQIQAFLRVAASAAMQEPPRKISLLIPNVRRVEDIQKVETILQEELVSQNENSIVSLSRGDILLGAMIETKEALHSAKEIAGCCDFVNFGGNDLTEAITGVTRGDFNASKRYAEEHQELHGKSPYQTLCAPVQTAIGKCVKDLRAVKPELPITMCGDQGAAGDEATIRFCYNQGFNSVCVSPVPEIMLAARIAAGKAALSKAREASR